MLKREFWKPVVKTIHYNFVKFFLASSTLRGVKNEISSFYFLKLECKILMFSEEVNHICHTTVHPYTGA